MLGNVAMHQPRAGVGGLKGNHDPALGQEHGDVPAHGDAVVYRACGAVGLASPGQQRTIGKYAPANDPDAHSPPAVLPCLPFSTRPPALKPSIAQFSIFRVGSSAQHVFLGICYWHLLARELSPCFTTQRRSRFSTPPRRIGYFLDTTNSTPTPDTTTASRPRWIPSRRPSA